ncbi:MAG: serine/threonine protein kinase, partial [Atopobiaceae bacterium]
MTTTPSQDSQKPSDILRLDSFEPAFAVGPELQNTQRKYKTLLVEKPSNKQCGGTSYVCRATTTDGLVLAVKRVLPSDQTDPQAQRDHKAKGQAALFQEYKALLTVSGKPGFPLVYGFGYVGDEPLILMEWVRGQTLQEAAKTLPHDGTGVRADVVCAIGATVLRVLLNAGGPGDALVHRDISSRNIMLRTDNRSIQQQVDDLSFDVVLIDFGSSVLPAPADSALTASGAPRFGTPAYAPPEMLTSDVPVSEEVRKSPLVDVYALCSVLYELYSGRPPFHTDKSYSYYLEKTTTAPAPLVPHRGADRQLCTDILSGIRQDPQNRPDTRELLDQLESWLRSQGLPVAGHTSFLPAQEPQTPSPSAEGGQEEHGQPRSITRRALLAGVGAACAAGAFFAWQALAKAGPAGLLGDTDGQRGTSNSDTTDEDGLVQQADDQTSSSEGSSQDGASSASALGTVAFAWPALDAGTNLWGLAQADGSWLVEPRFAQQPCSWSSHGTPARDESTGLWGVCADDGTWVVQPQFA